MKNCNDAGIKAHPARFPARFPEFFIKFLSEEGDLVLDPFAGSNTTGYVAETLQRRWLAFEINEEYLKGSLFRFDNEAKPQLNLTLLTEQRYHNDSSQTTESEIY